MNKTTLIGLVTIVFGITFLIGAIAACPCKHALVSSSIFMILTGLCFICLGKDFEKALKAKQQPLSEKLLFFPLQAHKGKKRQFVA